MIPLMNRRNGYGLIARWVHWGMAVAILAMVALGLWMTSLSESIKF